MKPDEALAEGYHSRRYLCFYFSHFFADKEFMELDKKRYDEALSTIDLIDAYRP